MYLSSSYMDLQKKKKNPNVNSLQFKSRAQVSTSPPMLPASTPSTRNPVISYKQAKPSSLCQKAPNRPGVSTSTSTSTSMSPSNHHYSAQPFASTTSTRTLAQSTQQSLHSNSSSTTTGAHNHSSQQFNPISTRTRNRSTQASSSTVTHFTNKPKISYRSQPFSSVPLSGVQTPTPTCICGEFTHKRISNKMCKYFQKYLMRRMCMGEERREQKGKEKEKEDKNKSKCSRSVDDRFSGDNECTKYNSVEERIRRQRSKKI